MVEFMSCCVHSTTRVLPLLFFSIILLFTQGTARTWLQTHALPLARASFMYVYHAPWWAAFTRSNMRHLSFDTFKNNYVTFIFVLSISTRARTSCLGSDRLDYGSLNEIFMTWCSSFKSVVKTTTEWKRNPLNNQIYRLTCGFNRHTDETTDSSAGS